MASLPSMAGDAVGVPLPARRATTVDLPTPWGPEMMMAVSYLIPG